MELSTSSRTAQSEVWPLLMRAALVLNGIIQLVYFLNAPVMRAIFATLDQLPPDVNEDVVPGVEHFAILMVALVVALSATLAVAVLWRGQGWLNERLAAVQSLPVWVTAFVGLSVYWGITLRAASLYLLALNVWWVLAYLVWNVLVGTGWLLLLPFKPYQPGEAHGLPVRGRLMLAGFFGGVVLLMAAYHLWAFSIYTPPDAFSYLTSFRGLFTRGNQLPLRSPTYLLVNATLGGLLDPRRVAWFHILFAAVTTSYWVFFLSRRSLTLAVFIGLFLSLDVSWSLAHRAVLTESPYATAHLLSLGVMLSQFERRDRVPGWALLLAGVLFAVTATIRPSGVLILVLLVLAYALFTRPVWRVLYVAVGAVATLAALMSVTYYRTGHFQLAGQSGLPVAYSLLGNNLLDSANGPISEQVQASLLACDPTFDQTEFNTSTSNTIFWSIVFPCLSEVYYLDEASETASTLLMGAYVEAVQAQPFKFAAVLLHEANVMLSHDTQTLTEDTTTPYTIVYCTLLDFEGLGPRACDIAADIGRLGPNASLLNAFAVTLSQLMNLPATFGRGGMVFSTDLLVLGGYLMAFAFLMVTTRGREQVMILGSLLFIGYVVGTVVAGHVFTPRYARVLTPFYSLVSAVVIAVGLRMFFPAIESRWAAFFARREPAIAGVLAVLLAALLGGTAYFFVGSLDLAAYRSPYREAAFYLRDVDQQRHLNLTTEEAIDPFDPDATIPYWSDDGLLYASDTQRETAENLDVWFSSYLPGDLRAAGFERIILDETWWQTDTALRQARLGDEQLYEVVHHWPHEREPDVWVLAPVDDVMANRRLYNDNTVAIYRVFESGIQVYALDENFNGTLVVAVPEDRIGEAATYTGDNGWTVEYAPGDAPRTYEIVIVDADGETVLTYPEG